MDKITFNSPGLEPSEACPGCAVCGSPYTEVHHIFPGTANRAQSEKYGLTVRLCPEHHKEAHKRPNQGLDLELKEQAQEYWESLYGGREAFIKVFGRSWL